MPELNAEQRLRDDAIVRGIVAQAQREAAQAVVDAVEQSRGWIPDDEGAIYIYGDEVLGAARAAAAKYGAGAAAGGDGR